MKHIHFRGPLSWIILTLIIILILLFIIPLSRDNPTTKPSGGECVAGSDCPQYRCPGVQASCINGFCKPVNIEGEVARCIDLKNTVCGNGICEGSERNGSCPTDCGVPA